MMMDNDLNDMQKDALLSFREKKGKQYKAILQSCWLKSSYPGMSSDHAAALQQIRNQFGPEWLIKNGNKCTSDRKLVIKEKIEMFMNVLASEVEIPDGHGFSMPSSNALTLRWCLNDIVESARQVSGWIRKVGAEVSNPDQFSAEFRYKHEDNSVHVFASSGNQYAGESKDMLDYAERNTPFVYGESPLDAAQKCAAIWNNALAHAQAQERHSESPAMGM